MANKPLCAGWCGACYTNRKGRTNKRGHWGFRESRRPKWEKRMGVLKKREPSATTSGNGGPAATDGFATEYPGLWEMLTSSRYPDGSHRATSTLSLFVDEGLVKACLNDRDQSQNTFVSGHTITDCMRALESGLQADTLQWRVSAGSGRKRR